MPSALATPSSARKLSEVTRKLVVPSAATMTGWPDIELTCRKLGTTFDRWQADAGRAIFSKTPDGKYAATVGGVGMSLPRQVGKTHLIGFSMFALCILNPGLTVIWTSQHSRTTDETLRAMQGMADREKVKPHVARVTTGNGDECVHFHNRSRILFGAREAGFGRGMSGIDVLVFDEAQNLTDKTLDAMLATMNTAPNGLALFMGTPPTPEDVARGWDQVFTRMRSEARSGEADDIVWIECGADPDADPADRKQWAKANPSYPHRTGLTSMLRLKKKLRPDSWLREGLGIWDEDATIFGGSWAKRLAPRPDGLEPAALSIAAEVDEKHATIGAAGLSGDLVHVRSLQYGPGLGWVVEAAKSWQERFNVPVVIDGKGPAASLIPNLELAGVELRVLTGDEAANAAAEFARLVNDEQLQHRGDFELDRATRSVVKAPYGDRWKWGRRKSAGDISPLEAVTLAAWEALYPTGGQNVFTPQARRQTTLVVGPLADEWLKAQAGTEDRIAWYGDEGTATVDWVLADALEPWQRDRFRAENDARVVIVLDDYPEFRPSKYGKEETVTIGGNL